MPVKGLITSCFGLGWLPIAPGTWGSLPPALLFALMGGMECPPISLQIAMAILVVLGSVTCVAWSPSAIARTGKKDPGEVVMDEVAGQALCFLVLLMIPAVALSARQMVIAGGAGFFLFRIFDVFKVWPGKHLERLRDGWGILADDLLLGVYAGLSLTLFLWLIEHRWEGLLGDSGVLNVPGGLVLGAIQGVTEFLPVSSSGHLVLLETFMGLSPEEPELVLFDLAVHVGTVAAIAVVFRSSFVTFIGGIRQGLRRSKNPVTLYRQNAGVRLLVLTLVATLVTGVPAFLIKDAFVQARGSLPILAAMWTLTAIGLSLADSHTKTKTRLRQFGLRGACLVGLAQLLAVLPGVSRSGATICTAILICGLHRRWAVEYSMLLGASLILVASAVEFMGVYQEIQTGTIAFLPILVGALMAFAVGIPSLRLLISASRKACFKPFAAYCLVLSIFALLLHLV